jgi:hypothetical protein
MKHPRITLVEAPRKRSMMEITMRYDVMLDGKLFSEMYYNMRGYRGDIPVLSSDGTGRVVKFDPGEKPLATFKREIAASNREMKAAAK